MPDENHEMLHCTTVVKKLFLKENADVNILTVYSTSVLLKCVHSNSFNGMVIG